MILHKANGVIHFVSVGLKALLVLVALLAAVISRTHAQPMTDLIINGRMAESGEGEQPFAGWKSWIWSGQGAIERFEHVNQGPAAVIANFELAKQAIFQAVNFSRCSYRLTAEVAAADLLALEADRSATFHVAFDNGNSITEDLIREGDSDWQRFELFFSVSADTSGYVYFFNYGIGRVFVRNVSLTMLQGCPAVETASKLSPLNSMPLNFSAPWTEADFALSGYCDVPLFAGAHEFCGIPRQKSREAPSEPKMLADFEGWSSIFSGYRSVTGSAALSGAASARLVRGQYVQSRADAGLPADWSGYDWLRMDVENPTRQPVIVYIEINDGKTTGYWSRVNWTTAAPPGRSAINVPLDIFVGEKVMIRNRRRLDLRTISRLVITATDGDIIVDNVRLDTEPSFANLFPKLIRFDFGPWSSPVMQSFTPVRTGTFYNIRRGYGFAPGTRIGRSEDRRHPDSLLRDWISVLDGGFKVALPNGRYHVWLMLEDPGYWEYYPSATRRLVTVEGRVLENRIRPYSDFSARFWRHAETEDLPGDDVWTRYIPARYRPIETVVVVNDGELNIELAGFGDPHAATLSALIVYPEENAVDGQKFIFEMWRKLKVSFESEHRQVEPAKPAHARPAANAMNGNLWVYHRGVGRDIPANDWPAASELTTAFDIDLPRGTTVPVVIGLLTDANLSITDMQLDLDGIDVSLSLVRSKVTRMTADGTVYANVPRLLDPLAVSRENPLRLRAHQARALLLDLQAKAEQQPGPRTGTLVLKFADGRSLSLAFNVSVKSWELPAADIPFGYLGLATRYPMASYPELSERREREFLAALELLPHHGVTAVSGGLGGPRFNGYANGKAQVDISAFRASVSAIATAGFDEVLTYDGLGIQGLSIRDVEDTTRRFKKPYTEVLRDVLNAIEPELLRAGIREVVHSIADEPSEEDIDAIVAVAQAFKAARPGVRTAAFTSITNFDSDIRSRMASVLDLLYLNQHDEATIVKIIAAGSKCSLYNQMGRYRRGIYHFKLRDYGCAGHMQFAFHSAHVDHWYDLDGREGDYVAVFTHPDGKFRRALQLVRYRQSISDYRHLMLLDRLSAGRAAEKSAAKARQWLQELKSQMRIGEESPWSDSELDEIRRQATRYIDSLQ